MKFFQSVKKNAVILVIMVSIIALSIIVPQLLLEENREVDTINSSRKNNVSSKAVSSNYIEETTATIGSTGDILIHSPILDACKNGSKYDFSGIFKYVKPYYKKYDYMVANLEVSLGGPERGYSGYPVFNCPDSILSALKGSGVDMLITANNHCFDTGESGFKRTLKTLSGSKLDFTGMRPSTSVKPYIVKKINNVKIGMINYTYETAKINGHKSLNGIEVSDEDESLINSFDYDDLPAFFDELETNIDNMYKDGAEAIVLYMHWGDEYKLSANDWQKKIAQKLCDLGVDVIIGGHPHVIEPVKLFNSTVSGKQTVCLYSMGNEISNQRTQFMEEIKSGHTEDGLVFSVTFAKKYDGRVLLDDVQVLPTWVNMTQNSSGARVYEIVPLDKSAEWSNFGLSSNYEAQQSYNRTMKLVKDGIADYKNNYIKVDLRKIK